MRKTLNRPDIIDQAIVLASSDRAVRDAYPGGFDLAKLLTNRPPELTIVSPRTASTAFGGRTNVVVQVRTDGPPIEKVDIFVNEQKVDVQRIARPSNAPPDRPGWATLAYDVPLFKGWNDISVVATSFAGTSPLRQNTIRITHTGEGALDKYGTLHIVSVGVDRYDGLGNSCADRSGGYTAPCHLRYAAADAKAFAEAAHEEMGPLHQRVVKRVLVTGAKAARDVPTKANIEAAIRELQNAGPTDTVAVFLAGHGEEGEGGRYYFLPTDVQRSPDGGVGRGRNLIDWSAVQGPVTKALGRRLMFVDACQSGRAQLSRVYNQRLLADARAERFTVFSATSPDQLAEESPGIGHGLFTYALIKGLKGEALDRRGRVIRAYRLGTYLTEEVRMMSASRQEPEFYSGHGDIVLVRE